MKKIRKSMLIIVAILLAAVVAGAIAFKMYVRDYYKADKKTISEIQANVGDSVLTFYDDDMEVFVPNQKKAQAVIVFYPGGKVEYKAYSGLMYELASRGFTCILPRMPENLAFLRINAVDMIKERYPEEVEYADGLDWYLAGHSLGGVAAAQYLSDNVESKDYKGLILCASYTTADFSDADIRMLSIYGSKDSVLNMEQYNQNKTNWPSDTEEYVIEGGIHSYFGNYGIQSGDGKPDITNVEQIEIAADRIAEFIY